MLITRLITFKQIQPICSQITNVMDRQTEGQTDRQHTMAVSRFALYMHLVVINGESLGLRLELTVYLKFCCLYDGSVQAIRWFASYFEGILFI